MLISWQTKIVVVIIFNLLYLDDEEKRFQETKSLNKIDDSFKKIVIVKDQIIPWHDEKGILYIGIQLFC